MRKITLIILLLCIGGLGTRLAYTQPESSLPVQDDQSQVQDLSEAVSEEPEEASEKPETISEKKSEAVSEKPDAGSEKSDAVSKKSKEASERSSLKGLSKKVSLDLRGIDIIDTIKFLSVRGDLNIVASKDVQGRITLFLKDVTIGDTLDVILLTNKLACEKKKNIITIMTEAEYEAFYGEKYTDKREIKTLKLKYLLPSKAGVALTNVQSTIGKIIMDDATGSLILIDTPEKIKEMETVVLDLDSSIVAKTSPTVTKVFKLKNAQAEGLEAKITEVLTEGLGSVRSDERTNKIIVRDLPNKIKEITEMVDAFDTRSKEVFIEAKIIEITLSDDFTFGVNWETLFEGSDTKDVRLATVLPATGITDTYSRMSVGTWQDTALDSTRTEQILNFLSEVGKVKIVSSPHITVSNNEEAKIMVGSRQPYATSTISQSDTTATTSWSAEFVDVGVTLTVTPTIYEGNFVKMHLKPEVSTLVDWFEIVDSSGVAEISLPEVDTSNAETDVIVQDGKTIIIAGLIKESRTEDESKVPFLGDIPLIGKLFTSKYDSNELKELVIFITPHIITGEEDLLYLEKGGKKRKPQKQ